MKGRSISIIFIVIVVTIVLISIPILNYFFNPQPNSEPEDGESELKIYNADIEYELSYNNSLNACTMNLGPFLKDENVPLAGAKVTLENDVYSDSSKTDNLGYSTFYFLDNAFEDINNTVLYGHFQKEGYEDFDFALVITSKIACGRVDVKTNKNDNTKSHQHAPDVSPES